MEYLKSGWKSVVGAPQGTDQPSVVETIEKLLERVQTSTLLEDRRDACRALKSLSKCYRLEVGAQGIEVLVEVLKIDASDTETLSYALDSLCNIISGAQEDAMDYTGSLSPNEETEDLGIQFTEIFAKKRENVALLLDLLEEFDFKVRWPSLKLLMGLLRNKLRDLQECILANPMGVSRLMDLLIDSREIIRNDAILLLVHLTRGNANIQKIVAFENAFDRLFEIISEEGYSDGGVVVEDCLIVLQNLLKNNTSNQNFFKEGSYIQRLLPFLDIPPGIDWSSQKTTNLLFLLQVIRTLVSPNNPFQATSSCQKVMFNSGLVEKLCDILMANGIPADLLTETINAVSEVVRGDHHNQEYLSTVFAPTVPPKPVIVVLLMSMVNEKQSFDLRCAVLYCFQCFLYKNELGQAQIVQTLLPNSTEISVVTAGQLLCGGLYSSDTLSNWFVATALSHSLVDNKTQKEQLLRVQLATDSSSAPVFLMTQCCAMLQQGVRFQKRIGILMLLSTWLSNCTSAVSQFLNIPTNVPYLTSQVGIVEGDVLEVLVQGLCAFLLGICIEFNEDSVPSFTKEDLRQLIVKRIGLEIFLDKLDSISKSESYSLAVQKPQLKYRKPDDVIFDYEFCKLFKSLEGVAVKAVQAKPSDLSNGPESNMSADQHRLVMQYKELIREQDQELTELKKHLGAIREENSKTKVELQEFSSTCQQLRDQNALLKAQKTASSASSLVTLSGVEEGSSSQVIQELRRQNEQLQHQLRDKENELAAARAQSDTMAMNRKFETIISLDEGGDNSQSDLLKDENSQLIDRVASLESELRAVKAESVAVSEELEEFRKEQEDLLVLLTDHDSKIRRYRKRLKDCDLELTEDEEDEFANDRPPEMVTGEGGINFYSN